MLGAAAVWRQGASCCGTDIPRRASQAGPFRSSSAAMLNGLSIAILSMFTDRRIERHQLPYFLRVFNSVTDKLIGYLGNVSEDGLMLISQLPMMIGADFELRLKIPASDGCLQVIDVTACCLWCH